MTIPTNKLHVVKVERSLKTNAEIVTASHRTALAEQWGCVAEVRFFALPGTYKVDAVIDVKIEALE